MSKQLKFCPYRVHGERTASLTVAGEFYYNETFMPCMENKCPCYYVFASGEFCIRNGRHDRLTLEKEAE